MRTCRESTALTGLPIVIVSGFALPALEDGLVPDAVLTKPFDIDDLCTVMDGVTGNAVSTVVDGAS